MVSDQKPMSALNNISLKAEWRSSSQWTSDIRNNTKSLYGCGNTK